MTFVGTREELIERLHEMGSHELAEVLRKHTLQQRGFWWSIRKNGVRCTLGVHRWMALRSIDKEGRPRYHCWRCGKGEARGKPITRTR